MVFDDFNQLYYLDKEVTWLKEKIEEFKKWGTSPGVLNLVSGFQEDLRKSKEKRFKMLKFIDDIPDKYIKQMFINRFLKLWSWTKVATSSNLNTTDANARNLCKRYIKKHWNPSDYV